MITTVQRFSTRRGSGDMCVGSFGWQDAPEGAAGIDLRSAELSGLNERDSRTGVSTQLKCNGPVLRDTAKILILLL